MSSKEARIFDIYECIKSDHLNLHRKNNIFRVWETRMLVEMITNIIFMKKILNAFVNKSC